jgi:acyl-CoA synthetase (AMP-forming)/AMP-acid ligase II
LAVANGEQMVLHIKFDPDRVLADISRKKITVFLGVPTMYTALVNHPKAKEFDLSSVQRWSRAARRCQWKSCNGSKHSAVMLRKRDTASLRSRLWGRFN